MAPSPNPTRVHAQRPSTRLPWWAVALPALAFAVLLAVVADGGQGGSAPEAASLAQLIGHIHLLLPRIM